MVIRFCWYTFVKLFAHSLLAAQMLITIKLTSFAFNLYDGHCLKQVRLINCSSYQRCREKTLKYTYWSDHALDRLPSLLEWYSYILFFPGYIGPVCEIADYLKFSDLSMFKCSQFLLLANKLPRKSNTDPQIPPTVIPAVKVYLDCYFSLI